MQRRARIDTPLKAALNEDGRRQSWLAERLNVDPTQVWGWVHGLHVPEEATQARIAALLERQRDDLFPPEHVESAA